eukprot:5370164-Prymnesium_polylepis.1
MGSGDPGLYGRVNGHNWNLLPSPYSRTAKSSWIRPGGIVTTPVLRLLSVSRPRATHDQLSPRG